MSEIITKFETLHVVAGLKKITGNFGFQIFFESLLGVSPETIDDLIIKERAKIADLEK